MNAINIPNEVTYDSVAALRIVAERGCDPGLYKMVASGFDALDMPAASESMRRRARHYEEINNARKTI